MPEEFREYVCNRFGLEWLDYYNEECYDEWQEAMANGTLDEMEFND